MAKSRPKKATRATIPTPAEIRAAVKMCFNATCDQWMQELNRKGQSTIANEIQAKLRAAHDERLVEAS